MTHPIAGAHPPPGRPREDALLDGLTPEQAQAVRHGSGPAAADSPAPAPARPHAHPPDRAPARDRRGAAVGDPRGHVLRARRRRAAAAARRPARRTGRRGVTAATFHSVCARLLREHAERVRPHRELHVYDQADMRRVIDWLLSDRSAGEIQQALADYGQPAAPRCSPRSRWPRTGCSPPTATSSAAGTPPRR